MKRERNGDARPGAVNGRPSITLVVAAFCALFTTLALDVAKHGAASAAEAPRAEFHARVTRIRDGDTIEVRRGGETLRVRVFGVDCPERGQPWSSRARQLTAGLVGDTEVLVRVKDRDKYGRTVGEVIASDGRNLGEELIRAGLAWQYTFYSHDATLARLEADAKAARRGLWSDLHPTAPWKYRREEKRAS